MYKRFFAFGCSFTDYIWHTWADIIAYDLKIPTYNYGVSGIGNVGIASQMLDADLEHNFNAEDLIITVWSSWTREDKVNNQKIWITGGNIFNNVYYDRKYIKKYWNTTDCILKNSHAIISTNKLYGKYIKFQGHISKPGHGEYVVDSTFNLQDSKIFENYSKHFLVDNIFNIEPYKNLTDQHPRISSHLNYVGKNIYPKLNLRLKEETKEHFKTQDEKIELLGDKFKNVTPQYLDKIIRKNDYKIKIQEFKK